MKKMVFDEIISCLSILLPGSATAIITIMLTFVILLIKHKSLV